MMRRDDVPKDIQDAARDAGLKAPLLYAGRRAGRLSDQQLRKAQQELREAIYAAREEAMTSLSRGCATTQNVTAASKDRHAR